MKTTERVYQLDCMTCDHVVYTYKCNAHRCPKCGESTLDNFTGIRDNLVTDKMLDQADHNRERGY